MKTRILCFLLASFLVAVAAWRVAGPSPAHAEEIPEKYRDTANKGLEFLVKNQCADGHWEGDGGKHPVAMTALAGIALLMEADGTSYEGRLGYGTFAARNRKYSANIDKAVVWLMDKSQAGRDGLIFSEHPSETARYMQGHGLATLFLAGACELEKDDARRKKLNDILSRAVKYIVKAQSTQGGWYHTSKAEGHDLDVVSATVLQIQALQAAQQVGITVPGGTIADAKQYLINALEKEEKTGQNRARATDTAAALVCLPEQGYQVKRVPELLAKWEKWSKYCQAEIPAGRTATLGRDELAHFYYAQYVFRFEHAAWKDYRTAMFDRLQSNQNKDGSWPAADGIGVGPAYSTAVWCIVLQLDKEELSVNAMAHGSYQCYHTRIRTVCRLEVLIEFTGLAIDAMVGANPGSTRKQLPCLAAVRGTAWLQRAVLRTAAK